jgi:hypothetical protein
VRGMGKEKLILIGACCWWSTMSLLISVLLAVHEALNVHAGRGDSVVIALHLMLTGPFSVALGIVIALKAYHVDEPQRLAGVESER